PGSPRSASLSLPSHHPASLLVPDVPAAPPALPSPTLSFPHPRSYSSTAGSDSSGPAAGRPRRPSALPAAPPPASLRAPGTAPLPLHLLHLNLAGNVPPDSPARSTPRNSSAPRQTPGPSPQASAPPAFQTAHANRPRPDTPAASGSTHSRAAAVPPRSAFAPATAPAHCSPPVTPATAHSGPPAA